MHGTAASIQFLIMEMENRAGDELGIIHSLSALLERESRTEKPRGAKYCPSILVWRPLGDDGAILWSIWRFVTA
jgi:hypothetical protein